MTPEEQYGPYGPGRDVAFNTLSNFRELGGYRTSDGRTVRHGLIWRGGSLGWLDAGELDRVRQIGFRCDLDFRSAIEADEMPDPRLPGVIYERSCAMLDARGDEIDFSPEGITRILDAYREVRGVDALDRLEDGSPDADMFSPKAMAVMDDIYVGMAFDSMAHKRLFAHLAAGEVPIVFHCTAGKDRTGVAAMLVLLALGVSEEDALYDYLLTNVYLAQRIRELVAKDLGVEPEDVAEEEEMRAGVSERMGRNVLAFSCGQAP